MEAEFTLEKEAISVSREKAMDSSETSQDVETNCDFKKREIDEVLSLSNTETTNSTEESTFESKLINFSELHSAYRPKLVSSVSYEHYTRGCKWSPDGLCISVVTDDNKLSIYNTPDDTCNSGAELQAAVVVKEPETIYDYHWYPMMNSQVPETCCFATTSQYQPVHLYDGFDGHLRATYRCYNHVDEVVSAQSLAFHPSGQKLFVGLKNEIRIFDVGIPGRDCDVRKTWKKKGKNSDLCLSGIISTIAFHPQMPEVYAVGTYSRHLALYMEPTKLVCFHEGQQKGGITHIQFTQDGSKLLAGGRKDKEILVWDLRNPGSLYAILHRQVSTNQRIYFDISPCSRYVISGGTDANVYLWDLHSSSSEDYIIEPTWIGEKLHSDCINGVAIHPWLPMLATSSGQRHFKLDLTDDSDQENETSAEYSLKLWNFEPA